MKYLDSELLYKNITERAEKNISECKVGGCEVIVNQEGKNILHEAYGKRSAEGPALQKGLVYRAASMTKPLTTAAVLHLVDEGKIALNEPAYKYFPALKNARVGKIENGKAVYAFDAIGVIRIFNLLNHTSGVGTDEVCVLDCAGCPNDTLKNVAEFYSTRLLAFDPYTSQGYSATAGFDLCARIIEMVTDMPYDEYLKKNILDPVGMVNTTFNPTKEQWDNMITMHARTDDGKSIDAATYEGCVFEGLNNSILSAGAGLATTADDYSRFSEMLLAGGVTPDGTRVLSENAVWRMRTPHVPESVMGWGVRWGLGVRVIACNDYPFGLPYGAYGWSGAYGTHFWIDPANKITAIYMKNSRYDGGAGAVTACEFEQDVYKSLSLG